MMRKKESVLSMFLNSGKRAAAAENLTVRPVDNTSFYNYFEERIFLMKQAAYGLVKHDYKTAVFLAEAF